MLASKGASKMGKKAKYETHRYLGIPVVEDNDGGYQFKRDADGDVKIHTWRIGKHTKGRFTGAGQLMMTENRLMVMIIEERPLAFKDRHSVVPMQRFLTVRASAQLLADGQRLLQEQVQD